VFKDDDIEIWARPLADGSQAVGIFNVSDKDVTYTLDNGQWTMDNGQWTMDNGQFSTVRDLWRQKDLSPNDRSWFIPSHGCRYLKITH